MTATHVRPDPAEWDDTGEREPLLEGARALRPLIEASVDQIERERRVPEPVMTALAAAGLLTMLVPRELGGAQVDPLTFLRVIEEVSRADGSTGWCLFVAAVTALTAGSLREDAARAIWGNPRAFVAGSITGSGTATVVNGGYRVRGHWSFTSGCHNATYLLAQATVMEGDAPRLGPNGQPEIRLAFLPVADGRIIDNWQVSGLLGTGSHDIDIDDLFVSEEYTHSRSFHSPPWHTGMLYTFGAGLIPTRLPGSTLSAPWTGLGSTGMAAAVLGMARGARDTFVELAATKTPFRRPTLLKDDPVIQDRFGRAEARLRAARALMFQTTSDVWRRVLTTGTGSPDDQTMLRLAGAHAAETAVEAIETIWKMAGTSGIFSGTALDRHLRDARVGAQNVGVSTTFYTLAGQVLLGSGGL
jgi:alkylation response protein AidB-like acyl-CoA dehydrogenase